MTRFLIGLGGNLGDVPAAIGAALARLEDSGIKILARSSLYRTSPWGVVEQPDFVNACALGDTTLAPAGLLAATQAVERDLGRQAGLRWGPRPIDLDILAFDDVAMDAPDLTLPHPRLRERAFVLVPLAEIAPDWVIAGRRIADWADAVGSAGTTRLQAAVRLLADR